MHLDFIFSPPCPLINSRSNYLLRSAVIGTKRSSKQQLREVFPIRKLKSYWNVGFIKPLWAGHGLSISSVFLLENLFGVCKCYDLILTPNLWRAQSKHHPWVIWLHWVEINWSDESFPSKLPDSPSLDRISNNKRDMVQKWQLVYNASCLMQLLHSWLWVHWGQEPQSPA